MSSRLRRLKELEGENARLKKMYAESSLAHHALQGIFGDGSARLGC
mgnify:CR=1 FL=1